MELPTFPYAVLKRAPVPRTLSSPRCFGRYSATKAVQASGLLRKYGRRRPLNQEGNDQEGHDVRHLDHRVDRRPGGVLVGVADGVAGDRRGVGLRTLAAVLAVLDQLLGVVPGAAARRHGDGEEEADHD